MEFTTQNPATGERLQSYPSLDASGLMQRVQWAQGDQHHWARQDIGQRAECLLKMKEILLEQKQDLARLMSLEMGKIYPQALGEIEKCASLCEFYAKKGPGFLRPQKYQLEGDLIELSYQPLGLILGIMPWNFPFWQVFRFAVPALMAGNGILLKHAPNVLGSGQRIGKLFIEAGFPENLLSHLIIDIPQTLGLIHEDAVCGVSVTASVGTGKAVAAEAGKALKKCVLELGGSDPFIVLADADLDEAARVGVQARFQNNGQSCIAAKRFIVVQSCFEKFLVNFKNGVKKLKMGNPLEDGVDLGPMARLDLRDQLHRQVTQSLALGAKLEMGGKIPKGPGAFYPPSLLSGIGPGMPAYHEELFGPVACFFPVENEGQAIRLANDTEFGLGGSLWTANLEKGMDLAKNEIEAGVVSLNRINASDPSLPFGGIKKSGYGRELSECGIREFTNIKTIRVSR